MRHALEQIVGIGAVVIRKGDHVRAEPRQAGVASAGEPSFRMDMVDLERAVALDELREPVVVVLVDEHDPKRWVSLAFQRSQQPLRLGRAIDRGDHEIE